MNPVELQKKLITAARANPPGREVPYAFEKRVMALLAARSLNGHPVLWLRGLWQAAVSCVAIALMIGAWALFSPATDNTGDLSQSFESTLLAAVDQGAQTQ
ncbi:MAG TPA: hypothetical protein VKU37_09575 [Verrucomicrobiae bacterium]|nr:hypothetical protein [Verrucomicrobiae bacterium]